MLILTHQHYSDVTVSAMTSQITGVSIIFSTVCSCADQRKHQSSASLAFVRGIHQSPVDSPDKGQQRGFISIWWRHNDTLRVCFVVCAGSVIQVFSYNDPLKCYMIYSRTMTQIKARLWIRCQEGEVWIVVILDKTDRDITSYRWLSARLQ